MKQNLVIDAKFNKAEFNSKGNLNLYFDSKPNFIALSSMVTSRNLKLTLVSSSSEAINITSIQYRDTYLTCKLSFEDPSKISSQTVKDIIRVTLNETISNATSGTITYTMKKGTSILGQVPA